MILCKRCRRVWASGTTYCQNCGGSLGSRICPDKHLNALDARFCRVCGSYRLSRGVPSANLSVVSWLIWIVLVWFGARLALHVSLLALALIAHYIWQQLFPIFAHLIVWSFLLILFGGPKLRETVIRGWAGLIGGTFRGLASLTKFALTRTFPSKPRQRSGPTP